MTDRTISIVIPVLNERNNIGVLLSSFDILKGKHELQQLKEIIFVDDGSSDGTVSAIKEEIGLHSYDIRILERNKKFGTVNATIAGSKIAESDSVIVMDGDLQHPPELVVEMSKRLRDGHDIIVASRHVRGGRNLWSPMRGVISRVAILIAYILVPQSRQIRDPTSGFFLVDRKTITELRPVVGRAKLLLYVLSSSNFSSPLEIPYTFIERRSGESKVVGRNLKFITNYLIEVLGYMRDSYQSRITSEDVASSGIANLRD